MSELRERVAFANEARVMLDFIKEFLSSTNPEVRGWACEILGRMARRDSLASAILSVKPYKELVSLFHDDHVDVLAMHTLSLIIKSPEGAQAAVDANALDGVTTLLESLNEEVRWLTCEILGELVLHETTAGAVLAIKPCERLVAILREDNSRSAAYALCCIAESPEGAQAVVDAKMLDVFNELVDRWGYDIIQLVCRTLGCMAREKSTVMHVLDMQPCQRLVSLLNVNDLDVCLSAAEALCNIAQWRDGAQAALQAGTLDCAPELLGSNVEVRMWTLKLLGFLARHLMSFLCDPNLEVIETATRELCWIARFPEVAQAAVDANGLNGVAKLLESSTAEVREWTCKFLGVLARHESTATAVWNIHPCPQLVSLLRDENIGVVDAATSALSQITQWPDGAQAAVDANVLDRVGELLESPESSVRELACKITGQLARCDARAVLRVTSCNKLVSLLRDDDLGILRSAAEALYWIAASPEGAQAALAANVQDRVADLLWKHSWRCIDMIEKLACHEPSAGSQLVCLLSRIAQSEAGAWDVVSCLDGLLRSLDPRIRQNACRILGVLTVHNTIAVAIFRHVDCCNRLVCLLDDTNMGVVESAAEVLRTIAQSEVDAPIVVSCLHELLQSRDPQIRQNACRMLRVLAVHNTGIFRSIVFCNWLVSLLDDSDLRVIKSVANAIQTIAQSALASMDTEILNYWAEANTTVDARRRTGYRPRKESPQKPTVVSESIDGILVTTVSEIVVGEVKAVRARRFSFDSDLDSDVDSEVQNRTRIAGDLRIA